MSEQPVSSQQTPAGELDPRSGFDHLAIQARMQDEIDELAAALEAQQRTIDDLRRRVAQLEQGG